MDWNELFKKQDYCLREPAEEIIRFVEHNLKSRSDVRRILETGFGAGRHVIYLAQLGYEVSGVEIAQNGIDITKKWLKEEGLQAELKYADLKDLPYPAGYFDAVICRGVITHAHLEGIRKGIQEAARVIRQDGLFLCTFISTNSSLMGKGERIDDTTWICDDEMEAGVIHHFMTRQEVLKETAGFFRKKELYHLQYNGLVNTKEPYISAHWVFLGERSYARANQTKTYT